MALTRQKKEWIAFVGLLVVAGAVWYVASHPSAVSGSGPNKTTPLKQINAPDFGHIILNLEKARSTEYKIAGRNIFVMGPTTVTNASNVPAIVKEPYRNQGPMPPAPPPPPTLPTGWVFYGYGTVPAGAQRLAFLKEPDIDSPHIVTEGELLVNHIRVLHIGNDRIDFEDVNTGLRGSAKLEAPPS